MANTHNDDNPFTDTDHEREAPSRTEFQEFQQITQQSIQRLQDMVEQLLRGSNRNPRNNDGQEDDGIREKPVHQPRLAPNNCPPIYDDLSEDEDYAEDVFGRNVGSARRGGGHGGVGRGGTGFGGPEHGDTRFMGNVYGGADYRRAYGEQPMRQDYGSKGVSSSTNITRQLVTIPPSNNPYVRPGPDKCFKCNQPGNRSHQCPRRQMVNLIETETGGEKDGENEVIEDEQPDYEGIPADADEGIFLSRTLVIQLKFMADKAHKSLEPWHRLDGKVVMVTGASSGLGRELCLNLALAGCKIVATARRIDRLKSLCKEIHQLNSSTLQVVALELDVSAKGPVIDAVVQKAWDAFGGIDALVNNAGIIGSGRRALDQSEEEWNNVFATNLRGAWLVSKFVGSRMRDANKKGSIINISSNAGIGHGYVPGLGGYATSKAGLNTITKIMALELGIHNIRVNSISPGIFKSEITENLMKKEWLNKVIERIVPLRTTVTSDPALTSLVRYLIHDSTEYVSGNNFIVDAGANLPSVAIFSSL
ncbi:hypothetical protein HHK36_001541 [Tetracentron sinense]|uniref:Ketoreductase domain-containing protein n=1 Tax=Tetracentron sinense TaxID=13715 RepID=A0A834ZXF1_TETSI|nr:hypothetical protein HHK36_001541 [Tetracentron sinense]